MSKTPELLPSPEITEKLARLESKKGPIGWLSREALWRIENGKGNSKGATAIHLKKTRISKIPVYLSPEDFEYPPEVQAAIDRNTPKKPVLERGKYSQKHVCPNCDVFVYREKFCKGCGQRLDWSEE